MYQFTPSFLDRKPKLVKLAPVPDKPLPALGPGLSFRPAYRGSVFRHRSQIGFLEIIAEHYMQAGALKRAELSLLASSFKIVPRGLNLSLGSACGPDPDYLTALGDLINALNPPWWSEHIAFTRTSTIEIGHLTPLPYTWEAVETVCRNVRTIKQAIHAPLILENITNRVTLPGAQMTEAEFIHEIIERTGCGLLLNLNSLVANATQGNFNPLSTLEQLPLERVVQLRYSNGPSPEIQSLLTELLQRKTSVKGIIVEPDEHLPTLKEFLPELANAREMGKRFGQWT